MNKLLDSKAFLLSAIFLFIFNISLIYTLQHSWINSVSNFLPIIKHINNLKYEIASGHLRLEEHLMGDINTDIINQMRNRQELLNNSNKLIKQVILDAGLPYKFFDKFINIQKQLQFIQKLSYDRLEKPQISAVGSTSDIVFDSQYNILQDLISDFDDQLNILVQSERQKRNKYFNLTIFWFVIFNFLAFFIFYFLKKTSLGIHKELLEQKMAFELIYQKSTDGVMLLNKDRIIDCNESLIKMLGAKTKNEVMNLHISDISPILQADDENSSIEMDKLISNSSKKGNINFQWLYKRFNGETFMVEVMLTHLKLFDKDIIHMALRDISERIRLEKEHEINQKTIFEQSKMAQMGTMLSTIAHQWKQPLSRINSKLIKLSNELELESDKEKILEHHLEEIESLTTYMAETIESFRTYFYPLKDKSTFYLIDTIYKAYSLSSLNYENSSIDFTVKCKENILYNGYEHELMQVIIVLLNNAKEAFEHKSIDSPFIKIVVFDLIFSFKITVLDNAGGIDDSIVDKIFNPYFSTKERKNNSGIGLAMAKIIIEGGMNGSLKYYYLNGNSNFTISLKS